MTKKLKKILTSFHTLQAQLEDFVSANSKIIEAKRLEVEEHERSQAQANAVLKSVKTFTDPEV